MMHEVSSIPIGSCNRQARPTVDRAFVWHIYKPLNEAAMQQAAATLIGSQDFSSFEGSLTDNNNPICHLQRLAVIRHDDQILIEAYADRFLKHMVRAMVGTVVEVGLGKRTPDSLADVLSGSGSVCSRPDRPASWTLSHARRLRIAKRGDMRAVRA